MATMNPEVKKMWVESLRSGDYQQGFDVLRTDNDFCCLGVLCDLYGKVHGIGWDEVGDSTGLSRFRFLDNLATLPDEVRSWSGLASHNPRVYTDLDVVSESRVTIAELNDTRGVTFSEIADLIEEQL